MPALLSLDPRSGVPIYLQVVEQIKRAVALGTLAPGEQLPTVKALALELTVNPNTVARAYRELERDAVIDTSPGRGSFVRAEAADRGGAVVADLAETAVSDAVRQARSLGISREGLRLAFDRALELWFGTGESS